ncbi:DUF5753 domain-containing protein [Streptosporangium sp. CA-115845]|uniref:DUF5753 domain-containing protein n=1 Tax=Streptosporangium sp. CA-115845 TaxID=3240071 RepID=UPI003D8D05CA
MARQSLLTQAEPLRLWAILDEAAVHRSIGGPEVMRAQLRRLLELADLPNVTIQVLPFAAGAHSGTSGAFQIMEFPEASDPDVVFLENLTDSLYVEREAEVYRYTVAFDHLRAKAIDPDDSRCLIAKTVVGFE